MRMKRLVFGASIGLLSLVSTVSCGKKAAEEKTTIDATSETKKSTISNTNVIKPTTTTKNKTTTTKENTTTTESKPTIIEGSLYFGSYPQQQVEASSSNGLSSITFDASTWVDYGYYINGKVESYMYYKDVDIDNDGDFDYRGVYFTQYRPSFFRYDSSVDYSYQDDNNYSVNTIYWFSYAPIKWNVLEIKNDRALIISELLLDAQYYNNVETKTVEGVTISSNNYMCSYIRSWLNDEFYNTAFNNLEKELIETIEVDNSESSTSSSTNKYICENTNDKIFLLSYQEANTYYTTDGSRQAKTTDYAYCQGVYKSPKEETMGKVTWYLRSPKDDNPYYVNYVSMNGAIKYGERGYIYGIRAVCWIIL